MFPYQSNTRYFYHPLKKQLSSMVVSRLTRMRKASLRQASLRQVAGPLFNLNNIFFSLSKTQSHQLYVSQGSFY